MLRIGADGVISKHDTGEALPSIIKDAYQRSARGNQFLSGMIAGFVNDPFSSGPLSKAELEVLTYMAMHPGDNIKEIGTNVELPVGTVNFHLGNIYRKFGVNKRAEAVLAALRSGIFLLAWY